MDSHKRTEIEAAICQLVDGCASAMIASLGEQQQPLCSYAPFYFAQHKGGDYVYTLVSDLSQHTHNLRNHDRASIMLIEDESETQNIFARKRLTLSCSANFVDASQSNSQDILDAFQALRGETVGILRTLPDFHLVEFTIINGGFVQGFGEAYAFDEFRLDTLRHLAPSKT